MQTMMVYLSKTGAANQQYAATRDDAILHTQCSGCYTPKQMGAYG